MNAHVYLQKNTIFTPADPEAMNINERLPIGTYRVQCSPLSGFYLEKLDDMSAPAKVYGDVDAQAQRILTAFNDRPSTTGVLLSGQKGAGKTMLTKRISEMGRALDVITVIVNEQFSGDEFNDLIQGISQPTIVLFDEFEKVYCEKGHQNALLTLFDGLYSSKKLFLLTCNERHRLNDYMLNRPGRIYYAIDFKGLSPAFIRDYCADNLKDTAHTEGVVAVSHFFWQFSFDMLKALVEEMNRFGESATQALEMLNMKPQMDDGGTFLVEILRDGKQLNCKELSDKEMDGGPLSNHGWTIVAYPYAPDAVPAGGITERERFSLDVSRLQKVHSGTGVMDFATDRPDTILRFTPKPPVRFIAEHALAAV